MTLSEMLTRCKYYLDNDASTTTGTFTRWSDAELKAYINLAYKHYWNILVQAEYDGITKQASIALVADTANCSLPTDFFKARIVYRVESDYEIPLSFKRNFDNWVDASGRSSQRYLPLYDFIGDTSGVWKMVLYPEPSFSDSTGLKIIYWSYLTELSSDSDTPPLGFSLMWHELIPLRAAMVAKGGREDEDISNLGSILKDFESPFYQTIDSLSKARSYIEPVDYYDYGRY